MFIKLQCLFIVLILIFVNSEVTQKDVDTEELREKYRKFIKPVFDIRIDTFPEHCRNVTGCPPSNCAEATKCTERSGYYKIFINKESPFLAFCNYNFKQGDWLYILHRTDGLENFQRSWNDYVKGFGNVDGDYWIGLDNMYALTNLDGPQELYVYLEDFKGESRYAKYEHFVIGNATERYLLKLGSYTGNAGNSLNNITSARFSTPDNVYQPDMVDKKKKKNVDKIDNDFNLKRCVTGRKSGWWFNNPGLPNVTYYPGCSDSLLTGLYGYHGSYNKEGNFFDGAFWRGFNNKQKGYSLKKIILMIRRQRIMLSESNLKP